MTVSIVMFDTDVIMSVDQEDFKTSGSFINLLDLQAVETQMENRRQLVQRGKRAELHNVCCVLMNRKLLCIDVNNNNCHSRCEQAFKCRVSQSHIVHLEQGTVDTCEERIH